MPDKDDDVFEECAACKGTGKVRRPFTRGDLIKFVDRCAVKYVKEGIQASLLRNKNMHQWDGSDYRKEIAEAILVDFVSYVGLQMGLDYDIKVGDLSWEHLYNTCSCGMIRKKDKKIVCTYVSNGSVLCRREICPFAHRIKDD